MDTFKWYLTDAINTTLPLNNINSYLNFRVTVILDGTNAKNVQTALKANASFDFYPTLTVFAIMLLKYMTGFYVI